MFYLNKIFTNVEILNFPRYNFYYNLTFFEL